MSDSNTNLTNRKSLVEGVAARIKDISSNAQGGVKASGTITINSNNFGNETSITVELQTLLEGVDFYRSTGINAFKNIDSTGTPSPGDTFTIVVRGITYNFIADTDFAIAGDYAVNLLSAINTVLSNSIHAEQGA